MKKTYPIWLVLALAVMILGIMASGGTLYSFIDIASFLMVVLLSFFLSLGNHGPREMGRSFRIAFDGDQREKSELKVALLFFNGLKRYFLISGLIGTAIGGITILLNLDDPQSIGPNVSISLITALYGVIFYIAVAVPFATAIKKQLLLSDS